MTALLTPVDKGKARQSGATLWRKQLLPVRSSGRSTTVTPLLMQLLGSPKRPARPARP